MASPLQFGDVLLDEGSALVSACPVHQMISTHFLTRLCDATDSHRTKTKKQTRPTKSRQLMKRFHRVRDDGQINAPETYPCQTIFKRMRSDIPSSSRRQFCQTRKIMWFEKQHGNSRITQKIHKESGAVFHRKSKNTKKNQDILFRLKKGDLKNESRNMHFNASFTSQNTMMELFGSENDICTLCRVCAFTGRENPNDLESRSCSTSRTPHCTLAHFCRVRAIQANPT